MTLLNNNLCGFGCSNARFKVYIANRPNLPEYTSLDSVKPMSAGEIQAIGQFCGNGWRKVFNVYAKLVFALNSVSWVCLQGALTWQKFRDEVLLQKGSSTSLLFSAPKNIEFRVENSPAVHIVMGKTYANTLALPHSLRWLDNEFAVDTKNNVLVCPYFDYRQLSNIKIIRLVGLIRQLNSPI